MFNEKKHIKISIDLGGLFTKYIAVLCMNGKEVYIDARIISTPIDMLDQDGAVLNKEKLEVFFDSIIARVKNKKVKNIKNLNIIVYLGLSYVENISTHYSSPYYENKNFDQELTDIINTSAQYDTQKFNFNYAYKNNITTPLAVCDTLIVGYDKNIINFYLKYFDKRNIFVQSISLNNLAIIDLLGQTFESETFEVDYSLFIDLGANSTEAVLLKNGFPLNYFVVNKGGNDLTRQIQEHYQISVEEAEELKVSINENNGSAIFVEDEQPLPESIESQQLIEVLDPVFRSWQSQIYQEINAELKLQKIPYIKRVYCTGGSSYIKNFHQAISNLFNAEQAQINIGHFFDIDRMKREADIIYYNYNSFLPALSLMKAEPINLATKEYIKSKTTKLPNVKGGTAILVTSLAVFIIANSFGFLQTAQNNLDINKTNSRLENSVSAYSAQQLKVQQFDELDKEIKSYEAKLKNKVRWSDLMSKIYNATPSGIQIIEVHEISAGEIEIVGLAKDYNLIGLFGTMLKKDTNAAFMEATPDRTSEETVLLTDGTKYAMKKFVIRGKIHENNIIK